MLFLFWIMGKMYFGFKKPKITILGANSPGDRGGRQKRGKIQEKGTGFSDISAREWGRTPSISACLKKGAWP